MTSIVQFQLPTIVLKNRHFILSCLGLGPEDVIADDNYSDQKVSIDYLIQSKFGGLFVCEFKFSKNPIGTTIIQEVQQKIDKLVYPRGFSVWPVLVHVNGVSEEVINSSFFSHIINFGNLLKNSL